MTKERIEKAVEVIKYAIENGISVKEASKRCGYADTYVKNVKAVVHEKYESGNLEDEDFSFFMDAYDKYRSGTELNTDEEKPSTVPPSVKGKQTTFKQDGGNAEINSRFKVTNKSIDHITTLDELLNACNVDTDVWQVKNHLVNKWDVTSWKNGIPETVQNFQIKAMLERVEALYKYKFAAELFRNMVKDYKPPQLNILPKYHNNIPIKYNFLENENNLFEICIFDLHIGKLAWHGETGEDYDVKIASSRFNEAMETLLYRASGYNYNKILFPIGNDFFNSDTIFNTTTKGTQQDEDLRWQKTFTIGCRLLVDGINLLKQVGVPIEVLIIPGNHDFEKSYYMGSYLEAWFNNDSQVDVNNNASPRKYYKFGEVLLGYTHGGEEKENSLPMLMASEKESKQYWSKTKYHEWHLGHFHRKIQNNYVVLDKGRAVSEDLGVTVRYLSSLTGTEEWHHKKGFVANIKAADGFIWNHDNGLVAHLNSNITIKN